MTKAAVFSVLILITMHIALPAPIPAQVNEAVTNDCGSGEGGEGSSTTGKSAFTSGWTLPVSGPNEGQIERPVSGCNTYAYSAPGATGPLIWEAFGQGIGTDQAGNLTICSGASCHFTITRYDTTSQMMGGMYVRVGNAGEWVETGQEGEGAVSGSSQLACTVGSHRYIEYWVLGMRDCGRDIGTLCSNPYDCSNYYSYIPVGRVTFSWQCRQ